MKKFFRTAFLLVFCCALAWAVIRLGPSIYQRIVGGGNTVWISERFSEELKEKNELVVYETTITGQETATQNAWLLGRVQEVFVPYSYSISFVVDMAASQVTVNGSTIEVRLPAPKASYSKLTVDENKMKKNDWLYPLTPERYAAIKEEIEARLFNESATKQSYLDAAWNNAVNNMENMFSAVAKQSELGVTCDIKVILDEPALTETDDSVAKIIP